MSKEKTVVFTEKAGFILKWHKRILWLKFTMTRSASLSQQSPTPLPLPSNNSSSDSDLEADENL